MEDLLNHLPAFLFWTIAGLTAGCAIAVVVSQNIVRSATWLLFTLGGVSAIFFLLGAIKPLQNDLKNLSFIHFARWVIIPRAGFPRLSEKQPAESLRYDYLLFFSNFNGTWNQYIDAFSAVLSKGLDLIWRWSEKYPGSTPVTPFKIYIARVQFDTDYYYNAYPKSATNDVKAANRVQDAVHEFEKSGASLSPDCCARAAKHSPAAAQSATHHAGDMMRAEGRASCPQRLQGGSPVRDP